MVTLVEDVRKLPMRSKMVDLSMIQYLYAFALNGRKQPGDRDRALAVINNITTAPNWEKDTGPSHALRPGMEVDHSPTCIENGKTSPPDETEL
ncbi:unnamed protein product [Echinostoma caproni]|uniref:DUF4071 domain-containing protein n=1 Tax=Echinostoma caproni TaxID=27848 RepID=A0A183B3E5_9TREM|nr:unnamed protein product [Echinostoma caproni]